MDVFDRFYAPTAPEENDDARRRALAEVARSKEYADAARGRAVIIERLIDVIFPKTKEKEAGSAPMTDLLLAVLETSRAELDRAMRRLILLDRLERLVADAGDGGGLRPADNRGEWSGRDQVYKRLYDDWDLTLGYFPDHVRHRAIYGDLPMAPPLIDKKLAISAKYHRTEHYMAPKPGAVERSDLIDFLKSPQLDTLAKTYGISYELPPLGSNKKQTTHNAKGGYKVMLETLEEELKRTPYSAPKLMAELSAITIFHEDPGLSFHLVAEFPRGRPDVGQNLVLAFGADLFNLSIDRWKEFKKIPPVAIAALEPLKG